MSCSWPCYCLGIYFICIYTLVFSRLCHWWSTLYMVSFDYMNSNRWLLLKKKNDLYSFVQIRTNCFWKQGHEKTLSDHRPHPEWKGNYGKVGAIPLVPPNPSLGTISRTILLCSTFIALEAISKTVKTNPCRVLEIKLTTLCYNQMKIIMYSSLLLSGVKWISSARILN